MNYVGNGLNWSWQMEVCGSAGILITIPRSLVEGGSGGEDARMQRVGRNFGG